MKSILAKSYIPEQFNFGIDSRWYHKESILYPVSKDDRKNKEYIKKIKSKSEENNIKVFDNKPMSGFRISHDESIGWVISDPRGFDIKVQSSVMNALISQCVIDHGEIISKCVWAWNSKAVLMSEDFDEYKSAIQNTAQILYHTKDLEIGDKFNFNNSQDTMIYLGKRYISGIDKDQDSIYYNFQNHIHNNKVSRFYNYELKHLYYDFKNKGVGHFSSGKGIYDIEKNKISDEEIKSYLDNSKYDVRDTKLICHLELTKESIGYINIDHNDLKNKSSLTSNNLLPKTNHMHPNAYLYVRGTCFIVINSGGKFYLCKSINGGPLFGWNSFTVGDIVHHIKTNNFKFAEIDFDDFNSKLKNIDVKNTSYDVIFNSIVNDSDFDVNKLIQQNKISIVDIIHKI